MRCQYARGLLSPYIDLALPEEQKIGLERHLASCESCRQELIVLQTLVATMRGLEEIEAPANFMEEMRERLSREKTVPFGRKPKHYLVSSTSRWLAATAASVALIFGIYISSVIPYPMVADLIDKVPHAKTTEKSGLSQNIENFLKQKEQQMQLALQSIKENRETPEVNTPGVMVPKTGSSQTVAEVPEVEPMQQRSILVNTVGLQMETQDVDGTAQDISRLASIYDANVEIGSSQLMSGVSRVVVMQVSPDKVGSLVAGVKSLGIQAEPMHGVLNLSEDYNRFQNRMGEVDAEILRLEGKPELDADENDKLKAMLFEKTYLQNRVNELDQQMKLVTVSVTITGKVDQ